MTYAIISCPKCRRRRMIDRSAASSACPYCGAVSEHRGLAVIFENRNQDAVRNAFSRMHSSEVPEKKKGDTDPDPLSTLMYRYEQCTDLQRKMELLAKGLTEIYGTFTLEDIEKIDETGI